LEVGSQWRKLGVVMRRGAIIVGDNLAYEFKSLCPF
jgi:hypothetical protein